MEKARREERAFSLFDEKPASPQISTIGKFIITKSRDHGMGARTSRFGCDMRPPANAPDPTRGSLTVTANRTVRYQILRYIKV